MEDIHFSCPTCSGHIVIDGEGAGRDAPCPHCGETLRIPMPAQQPAHALPSAQAATPAPDAHSRGGLSLQKNPAETWKQQTRAADAEEPSLLAHQGFDTGEEESGEGQAAGVHRADLNLDQPWFKKKDQWFTENGKKYHYCYYDPGSRVMMTACGAHDVPVSADVAPNDHDKLRKHAFCKKCLQALTAR